MKLEKPLVVYISRAERDRQEELRVRSYELAVQRGHMRRERT